MVIAGGQSTQLGDIAAAHLAGLGQGGELILAVGGDIVPHVGGGSLTVAVAPGIEVALLVDGEAVALGRRSVIVIAGQDGHQLNIPLSRDPVGGGAEPVAEVPAGILDHPGGNVGAALGVGVRIAGGGGKGGQLVVLVGAGGVDLGADLVHLVGILHPNQHQGMLQSGGHHVGVLHILGVIILLIITLCTTLTPEHIDRQAPVVVGTVAQLAAAVGAPAEDVAVGPDGEGVVRTGCDGGNVGEIVGIGGALALQDLSGIGQHAQPGAHTDAQLIGGVETPAPDLAAVVIAQAGIVVIIRGTGQLSALGEGQGMVAAGGHGGDEGMHDLAVPVAEADLHGVVVLIGIVHRGHLGGAGDVAQLALLVGAGGVDLTVAGDHDQMLPAGGDGHHVLDVLLPSGGGGSHLHLGGIGTGDGGAVTQLALVVVAPGPDGTVGAEGGGELPAHHHIGGHGPGGSGILNHGDVQRAGVLADVVGDTDQGGVVDSLGRADHRHITTGVDHHDAGVNGGPLEVPALRVDVHGAHTHGAAVHPQVEAGDEGLHQGGVLGVVVVVDDRHLRIGDGDLGDGVGAGVAVNKAALHSGEDRRGGRLLIGQGVQVGLVFALAIDLHSVDGQSLGLQIAHLDRQSGQARGRAVHAGRAQLIVGVGAPGEDEAVGAHRQGVGIARVQSRNAHKARLGGGVPGLALTDHGGLLHIVVNAVGSLGARNGGAAARGGIPAHAGLAAGVQAPGPGGVVLLHQHTVILTQADPGDLLHGLTHIVGPADGGHGSGSGRHRLLPFLVGRGGGGLDKGGLLADHRGDGVTPGIVLGQEGGLIDMVGVDVGHHLVALYGDVGLLALDGELVVPVAGGGLIIVVAAPDIGLAVRRHGGGGVGPGGDGDDAGERRGRKAVGNCYLHLLLLVCGDLVAVFVQLKAAVLILLVDGDLLVVLIQLILALFILLIDGLGKIVYLLDLHMVQLAGDLLDHLVAVVVCIGAVADQGILHAEAVDDDGGGLIHAGGIDAQQLLGGGGVGKGFILHAHLGHGPGLSGGADAQLSVGVGAPAVDPAVAAVGLGRQQQVVLGARRHLLHGVSGIQETLEVIQRHRGFGYAVAGGPGVDLTVCGEGDDLIGVGIHLVDAAAQDGGGTAVALAPGPELTGLVYGQGVVLTGLHLGEDHGLAVLVVDHQVVGVFIVVYGRRSGSRGGLGLLTLGGLVVLRRRGRGQNAVIVGRVVRADLAVGVGAPEPEGAVLRQGGRVVHAGGDHHVGLLGAGAGEGHPELAGDLHAAVGDGGVDSDHAGLLAVRRDQDHGGGVRGAAGHAGDLVALGVQEYTDAVIAGAELDHGILRQGNALAVPVEVKAVGKLEADVGGIHGQLLGQAQRDKVRGHIALAGL